MTTKPLPTAAERAAANAWADRLLTLIDVAQEALARDDVPTALMALREGIESAPHRQRKAAIADDRAERP